MNFFCLCEMANSSLKKEILFMKKKKKLIIPIIFKVSIAKVHVLFQQRNLWPQPHKPQKLLK